MLLASGLLFMTLALKQGEAQQRPLGISFFQDPMASQHRQLRRDEQASIPSNYLVFHISDNTQLWQALASIHRHGGKGAVVFADGDYTLDKTINIEVPAVMLLSESADPEAVIISGLGMRPTKHVDNLIRVGAAGFVLDGITLRGVGNHLIQIAGENGADKPIIRNCILQDSYQQLVKVSYDGNRPEVFSDSGLIEYCRFEYTAGIGPNYYIGGIDAHGVRNWVIRNNVFKDIASPAEHIAEHAIHLWNNASHNFIEGNIIVDSDRGIGLGMRLGDRHPNVLFSNLAGVVKGNYIYHADNNDPFADTGIVLEDSPHVLIEENFLYLEHNYPRSIEYRYEATTSVMIKNNSTNRPISSRNNGVATLLGNNEKLTRKEFFIKLNDQLAISSSQIPLINTTY